jgi:N-acetylmuramoyl-L-alanine amidase
MAFQRSSEPAMPDAILQLVRAILLASLTLMPLTLSPIGRTSPDPTAAPLAGVVIALDPGHNGGNATHLATINKLVFVGNGWKACNTVGTSTRSGYPEHRFTFAVALRLKARLEALGALVYMTRTTDTGVGPCVDVRGKFGAKVHAALEVSIHGDGSTTTHYGFNVMKPGYIKGYTDDIVARSSTLATAIRQGLAAHGLPVGNYYGVNGIKTRTDLGTLNMSDVAVVMVELGNMKNSADAARMTSSTGRDRYAAALVDGIRTFLGK